MYINFNQIDKLQQVVESITTSNLDVDTFKCLNHNQRSYLKNEIVRTLDEILNLE